MARNDRWSSSTSNCAQSGPQTDSTRPGAPERCRTPVDRAAGRRRTSFAWRDGTGQPAAATAG
jgi:hypothetical protein